MQQGFYKQSASSTGFCQFSQENRDIVRRTNAAWLTVTTLPPKPCTFPDSCDRTLLFAGFPGDTAKDSCGASYKIENDCKLTAV